MTKSNILIEGNYWCLPPIIGELKATCTWTSYYEDSQTPEFLLLCISRVTSVPKPVHQPPAQLGAGLEAQGTLQRFYFSKIVAPAASLQNRRAGGICL